MMTLRPYQSAVFRANPFRCAAVAGERVGGSEEAGAVSVDRSFVYLSGCAVLLNHSLPKNGDPVSDAQGIFRVVSHEDGGSFDCTQDIDDFVSETAVQRDIKAGEWLVQ